VTFQLIAVQNSRQIKVSPCGFSLFLDSNVSSIRPCLIKVAQPQNFVPMGKVEFDQTAAFVWLNAHAAEFGYNLSHPPQQSLRLPI